MFTAKNNKMDRALGGMLGPDASETRHSMSSRLRGDMTARWTLNMDKKAC